MSNRPKIYDYSGIHKFFLDNFNYQLSEEEAKYIANLLAPKCEAYIAEMEMSDYDNLNDYWETLKDKMR